jgi:hypothetical protein
MVTNSTVPSAERGGQLDPQSLRSRRNSNEAFKVLIWEIVVISNLTRGIARLVASLTKHSEPADLICPTGYRLRLAHDKQVRPGTPAERLKLAWVVSRCPD